MHKPISEEGEIKNLYAHLDKLFVEKGFTMNENERYLEIVVNRSAFNNFLARREETGVDFVGWIQNHVDLLNRTIENAAIPSSLRVKLSHIIVVEDSGFPQILPDVPYDQQYWGWGGKFAKMLPKGVNQAWHVVQDPRPLTTGEFIRGRFWSFSTDTAGNLIVSYPAKGEVEKRYMFPPKQDSLSGETGLVNYDMIHEWTHHILGLPDERSFSASGIPYSFQGFKFQTSDNIEPNLSPYSSILIEATRARGLRGYRSYSPDGEIPSQVTLRLTDGSDMPFAGEYSVLIIRNQPGTSSVKPGSYFEKEFNDTPFIQGQGQEIVMTNQASNFPGLGEIFIVRAKQNGNLYEIYLPQALLNMSKLSGKDSPQYEIRFTEYNNLDKKEQVMEFVMETDLQRYIDEHRNTNNPVYASMKIDGTSVYAVWTIR